MRVPRFKEITLRPLLFAAVAVASAGLLIYSLLNAPKTSAISPPKNGSSSSRPWIYGRTDARFTIVEYADLMCPYCRAYFPVLKQWVDTHPEVNWQWHHLPLSMHDPAATNAARLAECAGDNGGNGAFWDAIGQIYRLSTEDGKDLPATIPIAGVSSSAMQACLLNPKVNAIVQGQAGQAAADGIAATPTLRLIDHHTGNTLVLQGPTEGDALLSAIDLLVSGEAVANVAPANSDF